MPLFARTIFAVVSFLAARRGFATEETQKAAEQEREESDTSRASRSRQAGIRGETFAYWYLRRQGYVVVGRNYRVPQRHGEIDLIGWDGEVLAFVEVKTRTTASGGPPEQAVHAEKQRVLVGMARDYLRRHRPARRPVRRSPALRDEGGSPDDDAPGEVAYRFDVLAIEAKAGAAPVVRLHKGAFGAP